MNILVCIKQVPQSESATVINADKTWIVRGGHVEYKMNRFDEYALEEALLIKERLPDVRVDVITFGPERCRDVLKRAFGMGADDGVHILSHDNRYNDPGTLAVQLGREAAKGSYDLILTGIMSEDMMQAQTGQMLAENLGWPCVSSVIGLDLKEKRAHVKRELEGGMKSLVRVTLPCVLTIQAGINIPRYPTLSKILKANRKEVKTVPDTQIDPLQSCEVIQYPAKQRAGVVLQGSREDKARELARILNQKNIMR
ncbi:MAG: electron transfer flavoprotein subunit beta/FixA family protein [Proteobacteria bacterium]|nr:electron transfer flavoprotein subunit beta/FixA family protein [Pseudomonadota bacterium]